MLKLLGVISTLIGVLTGAATIVGWVTSSETFWTVAATALSWAGLAYAVLVLLLGLALVAVGPDVGRRIVGGALAAIPAACLVATRADPTALAPLAVAGLATPIFFAPEIWRHQASKTRTCPECAETVKAAARVCRYCGHRFAGSPPWAGG